MRPRLPLRPKQKKKAGSLRRIPRFFFFCFFCFSAEPLSAQESVDAVVVPRASWNGFLTDWRSLKQSLEALEERRRSLQQRYDPLPPKLEALETTLRQSEETSRVLQTRLQTSAQRLAELTALLKKQTGQTASLERKVRFYQGAFYVSLGAALVGAGAGILGWLIK